jgi:hypothetical protein
MTDLGELVMSDGSIIGHRALKRVYKQVRIICICAYAQRNRLLTGEGKEGGSGQGGEGEMNEAGRC